MNALHSLLSRITLFFRPVAAPLRGLRPVCCPTGVRVSDAALSRRDKKLQRLYEQGASKQRIAKYLARWLGWAGLVPGVVLGSSLYDSFPDPEPGWTPIVACAGPYTWCEMNRPVGASDAYTADIMTKNYWLPFVAVLPDNEPGGGLCRLGFGPSHLQA